MTVNQAVFLLKAALKELSPGGSHPLILVYEGDLINLYEGYAEDEGLPAWPDLTDAQRIAGLGAVVRAHETIDEYHTMVDAIEGAA